MTRWKIWIEGRRRGGKKQRCWRCKTLKEVNKSQLIGANYVGKASRLLRTLVPNGGGSLEENAEGVFCGGLRWRGKYVESEDELDSESGKMNS
jgi:hypothetical protein